MSIAWPKSTGKGLGQEGSGRFHDPQTESAKKRVRVLGAAARVCKTPIHGFESRRRLLDQGLEKGRPRVSETRGDPCAALLIPYKGPDS
jgi:hypothetical protein